jgi:hypothetical protein
MLSVINAFEWFCSVRFAVLTPRFSEILYNNRLVDRPALIKWHLNCTRYYSSVLAVLGLTSTHCGQTAQAHGSAIHA